MMLFGLPFQIFFFRKGEDIEARPDICLSGHVWNRTNIMMQTLQKKRFLQMGDNGKMLAHEKTK
jgi:hypothetical protein